MNIEKPKYRSTYSRLAALIILFLLLGCEFLESAGRRKEVEFPDSPLVDESFVSDQPCKAPCWYNLNLEESTIEDIRKTLPTLPFVDKSRISEQKIDSSTHEILFLVGCVYSEPLESCAYLQTSPDGILSHIYLIVHYPLDLQSVIEKLGEPAYFIANPRPSGNICEITFYWPEHSIIADALDGPIDRVCIKRGSEIIRLDIQVKGFVYTKIKTENIEREGLPWP